MSNKKMKDVFGAFYKDADGNPQFLPTSVTVVNKDSVTKENEGKVEVAGTVIVDGAVNAAAVYGDGKIAVKGYAGAGSVKDIAGVELTADTKAENVSVLVEDSANAALVTGAKVFFTAEDKKGAIKSGDMAAVTIGSSEITILDAKATDVFGGAVTTDTASSKKYKIETAPVVEKAVVNVYGGTVTNIYGGGTGLSATGDVEINVAGSKVSNIYAGGAYGGDVYGDVVITVDMNAATGVVPMNIGTIYAGGLNASVYGDVTVVVTTNGAHGGGGQIGTIVGTASKDGVVVGDKVVVLKDFQGNFDSVVKNIDSVTITGDSAVTFTKAQDKSMVNSEYIIEITDIGAAHNNNQGALLTLTSAYTLNKLTIAIDGQLINEGGSFSRALIQGVSSFNSANFDVDQINVKTLGGDYQIADYQYELKFETTTDAKGKEVETGKVIFTYTGAELVVSVDGYTNRHGVKNVLSDANDYVTFSADHDILFDVSNEYLNFNFKTMAGNDTVTIDGDVLLYGLALGAGDDKLTINGGLSRLNLAGKGDNLVVINGALDARNISSSADSFTTFVLNGAFAASEVEYPGVANESNGGIVKVKRAIFVYEDGSTTENAIDSKKKIVMATVETETTDPNTGEVVKKTITEPWTDEGKAVINRYLESCKIDAVIGDESNAQDLTIMEGSNKLIVNKAEGVKDITLGGVYAEVVVNDDMGEKEIDFSQAESSKLVLNGGSFEDVDFVGSRKGANVIEFTASYEDAFEATQLNLNYHKSELIIGDAVEVTINGFGDSAVSIDNVEFGYNSSLTADGVTFVGDFAGNLDTDEDLIVLGKLEESTLGFSGDMLKIKEVVDSKITAIGAETIILGGVTEASITIIDGADVTLKGAVAGGKFVVDENGADFTFNDGADFDAASSIVLSGDDLAGAELDLVFNGAVNFDGTLNVGNGTANLTFEGANVTISQAFITSKYVSGDGTHTGSVNFKVFESDITLNQDITINNLTIKGNESSNFLGDGKLFVDGDAILEGVDVAFGSEQKIDLTKADSIEISDGDVTIADGYTVEAENVSFDQATVSGGAVKANVTLDRVKVEGTDFIGTVSASESQLTDVAVDGTLTVEQDTTLTDVAATGLVFNANATLAGEINADTVEAASKTITLADGAALNAGALNAEAAEFTTAGNATITAGTAFGSMTVSTMDGGKVLLSAKEVGGLTINGNVELDVETVNGALAITGNSIVLDKDLKVNGMIDMTGLDSFTGNVRVYGYDPYEVPNYILVNTISLDGIFEADIVSNGDVTLSADTKIVRYNETVFNTNAYGTLSMDVGTLSVKEGDAYVQDGEGAYIQKGVTAYELTVLGNVKADFTVYGALTMGKEAAYEDYVTFEDDAAAAVNSKITGNVAAGDLYVAGAGAVAEVTGEVAAGAVTVAAGGTFNAVNAEIVGAVTLGTEDDDKTAPEYNGKVLQNGAVASFDSLIAGSVVLEDNIAANEVEGAKLDVAGELNVGAVTVGAQGAVTAGSFVSNGSLTVEAAASFETGAVTLSDAVAWDATAEGAVITAGDVTFESLFLDGNITVGALSVGVADAETGAKFEDALLAVGETVVVNGDITMDAINSNTVILGKDKVIAGALNYLTDNNTLNIEGSATVNALSFVEDLTINFTAGWKDTDGDGVEDKAYAEFKSDINMSANEDALTIDSDGYAATVEMGAINFGAADDGNELNGVEYDELNILANVKAAGVTADDSLTISGSGTLESNVTVGDILSVGDIEITGDVVVGADMEVHGDAVINSNAGLDLSNADLDMTDGTLTVKASRVEDEVTYWDQTGAIKGGDSLKINVAGSNTINADIDSAIVAEGDTLSINGTVDGAADFTELAAFGGEAEVKGGVTFDQITVISGADITADFTGEDAQGKFLVEDGKFTWVETSGPIADGATAQQGWNSNNMTIEDAAITGQVDFGKGADVLNVVGYSEISHVAFGESAFNDETMLADKVTFGDATLATFGMTFENNLTFDGAVLSVDRNAAFAGAVADVNKQIAAIFPGVANLEKGGYTVAELESNGFSFVMDGKVYNVTFAIKDANDELNASNITVSFDKDVVTDTIIGSDSDNELTINGDVTVDGGINLQAGNDKVTVDGSLTLKELAFNGFDVAWKYDVVGGVTGVDGAWGAVGTADYEFAAETAVLALGAGVDAIELANGASITASKITGTTISIATTGFAGVAADIDAETLLTIGDNLSITGDITAPAVIIGKGVEVEGEITAASITIADATVNGTINGNVVFAGAGNLGGSFVANGKITLASDLVYTAEDLEADPVIPANAEFSGSDIVGDIKAGKALEIVKAVTVTGDPNGVTAAADTAAVGSITGVTEEDVKVSNVVLSGAAVADPLADANVTAGSVLAVGAVSGLASLTVNNAVKAEAVSGVDTLTLKADSTLNITGGFAFTNMKVVSEGEDGHEGKVVAATLEGTAGVDTLTLSGNALANTTVNFGAAGLDAEGKQLVDRLVIEKLSSVGGVTFSEALEISGSAALTAASLVAANGASLTITGSATLSGVVEMTGAFTLSGNATVSGTAADDVLTLTKGNVTFFTAGGNDKVIASKGTTVTTLATSGAFGLEIAELANGNLVTVRGADADVTLDLTKFTDENLAALDGKNFTLTSDVVFANDAEIDLLFGTTMATFTYDGVDYNLTYTDWADTDASTKKYTVAIAKA